MNKRFSRNNTPKKQRNAAILIVCEGETESNYFNAVWAEKSEQTNFPRPRIKIVNLKTKTTALQLLNYAKETSGAYHNVYIVFDRDKNNVTALLQEVERLNKDNNVKFIAIPSIPCFELWFLLHFLRTSGVKNNDEVVNLLNKNGHMFGYDKSDKTHYHQTKHKIDEAEKNAISLRTEHTRESREIDRNCYTNVDILVRKIQHL